MRLYGLGQAFWRSSFRRRRWETRHSGAPGYVYVMRGDGPAVKIGSSNDPERRRRELQTGTAVELQILHTVPVYGDPVAVERDAQDMLAAHRVRLEWYDVPPDLAVGAIYSAAFRLGALSPFLDADRPRSLLLWAAMGATASLPFWWLASHDNPLGAVAYMTGVLAIVMAARIIARRRMPLRWLVGGATAAGALFLAWPATAAEPVPAIDGTKYCDSIAGFIRDNEFIKKGCIDGEAKAERRVRALWAETPASVQEQCRKTLALVTPSYQGLSGCMSLAVGTMWGNGELRIVPR